MPISHRLKSSMYDRPDEGLDELPKRIVFLSVEGNLTERDYFHYIHQYRGDLRINSLVHIETLSRGKDTSSDLESIVNLLDDFLALQKHGLSSEEVLSNLLQSGQSFSLTQIEDYLRGRLKGASSEDIEDALRLVGIDLNYQLFLRDFKGEDGRDVFAVVIDRDRGCHSEQGLRQLFQDCNKKGYDCYITNPCFEFWLLLHICDVKSELSGHLADLLENKRISNKHTYVSKRLSDRVNHAKHISENAFITHYLPNIDLAISRAEEFKSNPEELLTDLGTNLPMLFKKLREEN